MKTNMKRKVKNLLLAMCIIGLGSATSAAMLSVNAAEQSATEPVPVLTMQEGASIKNFAPSGIRFVSKLSVDNYTELTGKGAKFYTLFVPASRVPEGGITKDNYQSEKIDAKIVQAEKSIEEGATEVTFSGVLVGLNSNGAVTDFPASAYNVGLTAVSYYTYTENEVETIEFASNPQTFSIAYIASALQAKGYEDAYYKDITNSVLTEGISFAETSYTVCVGGTAETVLNSKGLKAVYTSNNEDIVTVDETGKLTGKALGNATITATIGDKTTTVNVTVGLGDTNFNAPKNPEDANCTCVNVAALDNADYAYFFAANDDETISYVDGGGIKATDASADENGKTVAGATLSLPKPLDVKNKDFIMSFGFKEVSGAKYTIWLYNEENKGAHSYVASDYKEGGGLSITTVDGVTTVKISSTKIAEKNYYCDWTNQTAKQITKIMIMNGTSEFVLTGIELSEQPTIISGGSAESLGYNGTVLADFEKNSDTCQNAYIADGNLVVKGAQYTYELPTAVAVTKGTTALKIRFKGGNPYFKFYDSNGKLLLTTTKTEEKENRYPYSAGFIDWPNHEWGGGVNITTTTDGDYIIITVSGEKVVGKDVKKIVFELYGTNLYVDYIVAVNE